MRYGEITFAESAFGSFTEGGSLPQALRCSACVQSRDRRCGTSRAIASCLNVVGRRRKVLRPCRASNQPSVGLQSQEHNTFAETPASVVAASNAAPKPLYAMEEEAPAARPQEPLEPAADVPSSQIDGAGRRSEHHPMACEPAVEDMAIPLQQWMQFAPSTPDWEDAWVPVEKPAHSSASATIDADIVTSCGHATDFTQTSQAPPEASTAQAASSKPSSSDTPATG